MSQKIRTSVDIDGSLTTNEFGISAGHIKLDTTPTNIPTSLGTIYWDEANRTAALIDGDGDTTLQLGQEQRALVHNNTGSTLTDGQIVYITGSTGEVPSVTLASSSVESTSATTLGMVTETIAHGSHGFITISGIVHGLNTLAFNEGDMLWLGTTPGTFTSTKPISPNHLVLIGYVVKKAGGNGSVFVKIQNTQELSESSDVLFTSLTNNDILAFEGGSVNLWKNKTIASVLGYTPYDASNPAGYISTYTETDPIYTASSWYSTVNNASNWNTAYGWGNHASAGYVPQARTITINGTSYDLSANRSWTITASETDTLSTVTARGNIANYNIALGSNAAISGGGSAKWITTDGTAAYGGGLISSVNGSAKAYYYFDNTNAVIQGAAGVGIAFQPNNTTALTINTSGNITANVDLRAPIFYDSNDTTYYGDFNSTTRQYQAISFGDSSRYSAINTTINGAGAGDKLILYGGTSNYDARILVGADYDMLFKSQGNSAGKGSFKFYSGQNCSLAMTIDGSQYTSLTGGLSVAGNTSWFGGYGGGSGPGLAFENQNTFARVVFWGLDFYDWNNGTQMVINDGYVLANNSMRSPIFYDSNNTGYYVDPASTSVLSSLNLTGQQNFTTQGAKVYFGDNTIGNPLCIGEGLIDTLGVDSDFMTIYGRNSIRFFTNGTVEKGRFDTDGFKATVMYDLNDTGYYADFNSTSNSAIRVRGGSLHGPNPTWGSYLLVGGDGRNGYIDSTTTASVSTTNGNLHLDSASGYSTHINYYDGNDIILGGGANNEIGRVYNAGYLQMNGSVRAPIFYDSNNTGFYLDPASTSNLNGLSLSSASTFLGGLSIVRNGGGSDPYGVLAVSCPSGDNYAYMGFTRNGVIGMAMGIDTSNNYWIGTSGGGHNSVRTGTYMTVSNGGTITATADVVAYSDKRVKENIETIDNALNKVLSLRGVTYNRTDKEDKSQKIGVIAQEIQKILPQVVQEQEDGMLGVSYGNITAVLIEAIKEQQTQIEELKQLVNTLTNK